MADNIRHPLSDVLLLTVNYGLVATLLCGTCFIGIAVFAVKRDAYTAKSGLLLLSCVLMLCLFSYPLRYPFTWLMIAYALLLVLTPKEGYMRLHVAFPLIFSCIMAIVVTKHYILEREWGRLTAMAEQGVTPTVMKGYTKLHPLLQSNPLFLYNEAAVFEEGGDERTALRLSQTCRKNLADYDLQLLFGDIYLALNRVDEALRAYKTAEWMIPSRIMPLYAQYLVYQKKGDKVRLDSLRKVILKFVPKVSNETVMFIKKQVEEDARE